jgi:plastin-1
MLAELPDDDGGDSREERAFRMWINSLGIEKYVNNLFDDVRDGMVILQVMDKVHPGVVDWHRVNANPTMVFKQTENCNYAVDLAKDPFRFSLVGVQGKDIVDGNKKLTLALFWQLMRYSLLSFLASLKTRVGGAGGAASDEDIVRWARDKVAAAGSSVTVRDLHDKSLSSGLFLIELLAAVEPRCIDRALVTPGVTEEEQKLNAKYAISSARKLGCTLFLLWEDIVEVRPKMLLSFMATVMATAHASGAA